MIPNPRRGCAAPLSRFAGVSLEIYGAESLVITAATGGTTLWFVCGAGVHVANSSDVDFAGFTIDYHQPCFAQGVVVKPPPGSSGRGELAAAAAAVGRPAAAESVEVRFDLEHFPAPDFAVQMADAGTIKATFWDPATLRIVAHGNHLVVNVTRAVPSGAVWRIDYAGAVSPPGAVAAGSLATLHPRLGLANGTGVDGGLTYLITNSTRVTTERLTLHGGATESVVEAGGHGGHVYRHVRVVRREPGPGGGPVRLLAANADGFHSSCVQVGPQLLDSELSFTGDDLLNIHSRISIVLAPLGPSAAYVIDTLGSSSPGDYDPSTLMLEQTRVGDTVAFFQLGSLAPNGTGTVTALERVTDPGVVAAAAAAWPAIQAPPYSQRINHPIGTRVWLVNWTWPEGQRPTTPLPRFELVDVPRLRPAGAVVKGCYMHDAYMRFGLYDSPGMVIEGNRFERGFPLYIGERGDGWLEGPPLVAGAAARNNSFHDYYGDSAIVAWPGTTADVDVADNRCSTAAGDAVPCQREAWASLSGGQPDE